MAAPLILVEARPRRAADGTVVTRATPVAMAERGTSGVPYIAGSSPVTSHIELHDGKTCLALPLIWRSKGVSVDQPLCLIFNTADGPSQCP